MMTPKELELRYKLDCAVHKLKDAESWLHHVEKSYSYSADYMCRCMLDVAIAENSVERTRGALQAHQSSLAKAELDALMKALTMQG